MKFLSRKQLRKREKTLLASLLLSAWGPLATFIAVIMSNSTTQLADFIRRSVELIALFTSWWVFRQLQRKENYSPEKKAKMEKAAGTGIAAALGFSGIIMLALALTRLPGFEPGGNVYLGLAIASLGLVTNIWFWQRYAWMTREHHDPIIDAQRRLYRAKVLVDLSVIVALSSVAFIPWHPAARYIDIFGSAVVAVYLLWSSIRTFQSQYPVQNWKGI